MRAGLVIGLVVLVGCGGEAAEVDGSRSSAPGVTGGDAGAPADIAATGGDAPAPASGGSLPADPTGGAPAASGGVGGGAVGTGGEDAASGGLVTGATGGSEDGGGEGGSEAPETGGAVATGGGATGGSVTGGESAGGAAAGGVGPATGGFATGGAEPTACTYTCTTTTTDADGATSASTTRSTYDPCVSGLAESARCTQTESVAIATVCVIDREPEPIECEPLATGGEGGSGGEPPDQGAAGSVEPDPCAEVHCSVREVCVYGACHCSLDLGMMDCGGACMTEEEACDSPNMGLICSGKLFDRSVCPI